MSANKGDRRHKGLIPGLGRSPGGGHGNSLQYSCLGKSHGQRSLVSYSLWGHKESDTTERLTQHTREARTQKQPKCALKDEQVRKMWYTNMCVCVCVRAHCASSLSPVLPFVTPWIVAHQAPLSMGILKARILEWIAMPSSRGSSQPRDWTQVSCITGRFFTSWATREAHIYTHTYIHI